MADLLDEFEPGGDPGAGRGSSAPLKRGVNYSHKAFIDLILSSPGISQNAVAAHFGYSVSWVSQVMSSDAFQAEFARRSAEIVDPVLRLSVEERFRGMVSRSMEILMEKLSLPAHQVPDQLALRAFELSTRAAGYGARAEPPVAQVNVNVHLEEMGENLTRLLARKRELIEGTPKGVILEDTPSEA